MIRKIWLALLPFIFLMSCRQQENSQLPAAPTPSASIAPHATPEQPPNIRTAAISIALTTSLAFTTQQDIAFSSRGLTIAMNKSTAALTSEKLPVTLDAPAPFLALSAKWSSVISKAAKLTVSVRASTNGINWSAWQLSSLDGDPRTQAGLFFFAPENKFIQYRIEMERDAQLQAPLMQSLQFRFISPGATPQMELTTLRASQLLTRAQWHCPSSNFQSKPQTARINHLIVHHTATANDATDWPAVVRTIWNFHAVTNGWRDVGYHYLIDPNGVMYEGRAGGEKVAGIHFSCCNTGTLGIAMLGNYLTTAPSEAAVQSLQTLLATKCQQLGLDPLGASFHASTGLKLPHIAGHLDANASKSHHVCAGTHCPGETLYAMLPMIRKTVAQTVSLQGSIAQKRK
jgi:N-acetylmuramoyl-L-alanine amidase